MPCQGSASPKVGGHLSFVRCQTLQDVVDGRFLGSAQEPQKILRRHTRRLKQPHIPIQAIGVRTPWRPGHDLAGNGHPIDDGPLADGTIHYVNLFLN